MKTARLKFAAGCFLVIGLFFIFCPPVRARHFEEIVRSTYLVNLEAKPKWFQPGQPIDFLVTLRFEDGHQDGFDIGVFHEGRLVGWEMNRRLNEGMNTFRIRDRHFRGDPGAYIVRVRFRGRIIKEKRFVTRRANGFFTIDPGAKFQRW
ncbi:MAG: hypothetical protein QME75_04255 [Deltaproteobacteria bacterium]|nr:hypothetical protein [Deltaproteobacteria bacterium]